MSKKKEYVHPEIVVVPVDTNIILNKYATSSCKDGGELVSGANKNLSDDDWD